MAHSLQMQNHERIPEFVQKDFPDMAMVINVLFVSDYGFTS